MQAEMEAVAALLQQEGRRPYVIPGGGSTPLGAMGYVNAALELVHQSAETRPAHRRPGACHRQRRHAGRPGGRACALNSSIRLLGIGVRAPREKQETMVYDLACRTWDAAGPAGELPRAAVQANCDYVGGGYGIPTPGMVEA
jgi:L-cysteate sulfo-lyase